MTVEVQQAFALGWQAGEYAVGGGDQELKQVQATAAAFASGCRPPRRWPTRK